MPINFDTLDNAVKNVNTGNIGDDPIRAEHIASAGHKRSTFGRAWEVGDQGTVFYPFRYVNTDNGGVFRLHTAAFFGHDVSDMKVLGTTFLRSNSVIDEHFNVIGNGDLAYQFSRLAPLLIEAEKEKALAEVKARDWSMLGESAYMAARKQVEDQYDTKENMQAKRPIIGKLRLKFVTECVYVNMDVNTSKPNMKSENKTGLYIQEARDGRRAKLNALANDVNMGIIAQHSDPATGKIFEPVEGEIYFLEVIYNFTSAKNSKAEAGRSDPQGVARSITLKMRDPDCAKAIDALLEQVPKESGDIAAHTYGLAPVEDEALRKKLQNVLFSATPYLKYLGAESKDKVVASAELFDYLRIAPKEDPELEGRLTEALGHPAGEYTTSEVPTFKTIIGESGPDFTQQPVSAATAIGDIAAGGTDAGFDVDLNPSMEG